MKEKIRVKMDKCQYGGIKEGYVTFDKAIKGIKSMYLHHANDGTFSITFTKSNGEEQDAVFTNEYEAFKLLDFLFDVQF